MKQKAKGGNITGCPAALSSSSCRAGLGSILSTLQRSAAAHATDDPASGWKRKFTGTQGSGLVLGPCGAKGGSQMETAGFGVSQTWL